MYLGRSWSLEGELIYSTRYRSKVIMQKDTRGRLDKHLVSVAVEGLEVHGPFAPEQAVEDVMCI